MKHKIIMLFFLMASSFTMVGQSDANSPYSRYGLGDLVDPSFYHIRQMGSIGNSFVDNRSINMVNPASYSYLTATSFDIGIYAKKSKLKDSDDNTADFWSGNLEYMALGFPLVNPLNRLLDREESDFRVGMAFALKPRSRVNYEVLAQDSLAGSGNINRNYTGSGGTYDVTWGTAFKYKNLSVGVNLGWMFGNIEYQQSTDFLDLPYAYNDRFATDYNINGFVYDVGLLYELVLNKKELANEINAEKRYFTFGATFNTATSFDTKANITRVSVQSTTSALDTALVLRDEKGNGKLPASFGLGVTYHHDKKFSIGIDYENTSWSEYYNDANEEAVGSLSDGYKFSLGGYYRPNYKSYNNYSQRIYYKWGLIYEKDPRVINNQEVDRLAVTFGLGLPFVYQRKLSHANIGIELGMRGKDTPIQENYINLTLGFNFSDDEWFLKRKYN